MTSDSSAGPQARGVSSLSRLRSARARAPRALSRHPFCSGLQLGRCAGLPANTKSTISNGVPHFGKSSRASSPAGRKHSPIRGPPRVPSSRCAVEHTSTKVGTSPSSGAGASRAVSHASRTPRSAPLCKPSPCAPRPRTILSLVSTVHHVVRVRHMVPKPTLNPRCVARHPPKHNALVLDCPDPVVGDRSLPTTLRSTAPQPVGAHPFVLGGPRVLYYLI